MAQPPPYPAGHEPDGGPEPDKHRPRWPSVLGIVIAAIVIGLFVYLHLAGIVGPGAH